PVHVHVLSRHTAGKSGPTRDHGRVVMRTSHGRTLLAANSCRSRSENQCRSAQVHVAPSRCIFNGFLMLVLFSNVAARSDDATPPPESSRMRGGSVDGSVDRYLRPMESLSSWVDRVVWGKSHERNESDPAMVPRRRGCDSCRRRDGHPFRVR